MRRIDQIDSRAHKILFVLFNLRRQPISPRRCADETEERGGLQSPLFAREFVDDFNRAEMTVARHASDLAAAKDLDVWCVHDAMGEITRHAFAKIVAADQEEHLARILRKINSRLPSRVT